MESQFWNLIFWDAFLFFLDLLALSLKLLIDEWKEAPPED
jgi:hypothetical protein